ncbi:PTS transporter subunit EIIC, partial [Streptococcus suis]
KRYDVDRLSAGVLSIASFVLLTPVLSSDAGNGFPLKYLGTAGLFVGIIVALISTEIFSFFVKRNIVLKMPDTVPPNVAKAFSAIIPGLFIISLWLMILILLKATGIDNIHALIADTVAKPLGLVTQTLPGILVVIFIQCFFWMFGVHGAQVTGPILEPLLLQNSEANRLAYQA